MDIYLAIIKLFLKEKALYNKYYEAVDLKYLKENFPELYRVFQALAKLREGDKDAYEVVDLEACLLTLYPNLDRGAYGPLLGRVQSVLPDPATLEEYLSSAQQRVVASKIAFAALDVAEGKATPEALESLVQSWVAGAGKLPEVVQTTFVSDDITELYEHAVKGGGLSWRLKSLNRSIGPLRKGDFGFIFARPETGKTTFLASEVTKMCEQTDRPVLWINNEEQGEKVGIRCYEAALGATLEQILSHQERARDKYRELTGGRLKIVDNASISKRDVEAICRSLDPALIVIDQLDKIKGFDGDREDLRMGAIYQWARELAKQYAPVIGVSQADGSGEGIKYLTMGNVANAKTAKQAEADWILGIGVSFEDAHPYLRGLSICKNKLLGGEETVPKLRHAKMDVLIEPEIGRYRDMEGVA